MTERLTLVRYCARRRPASSPIYLKHRLDSRLRPPCDPLSNQCLTQKLQRLSSILSLKHLAGLRHDQIRVDSLWTVPEGSLGVSEPVWEPGATGRFAVEDQGWITIVDGHTGTSTRIHSTLGRLLAWSPQGLVVLDENTLVLRLLSTDGLVIGELTLVQSHAGSPHGRLAK